jgi:hypothetical protein
MTANLPTIEVLFAPSVIGSGAGSRFVLNVSQLDTGTLGDGAFFYDISQFVRSFSINRGRRSDLERFTTGTAQIVLSNLDRRFDPSNTSSPYYNSTLGVTGVVPAIPVVVRATWAGITYPLFRGFIDSWSFDYSGTVGDAIATINCSDAFKVLSNVIGGLPSATTITSTSNTTFDTGVTVPIPGSGTIGPIGGVSIVDETSSTGSADVVNNVEQTPLIGTSGDLSGQRITTILNAISWPENLRAIDEGTTRLAVQNASKTVLEMLQEVAETETGAIYIDADGTIIFDDRVSLVTDARSITPQAVFDTTTGTGKEFTDVTLTYDDDLIYNIVRINRKVTTAAGGDAITGTTVIVSNPESISLYGARTLALELPLPSSYSTDTTYGQSKATDLATALTAQYANPELRPDSVVFKPLGDPADLWPEMLGRKLRDRVTVKFNVPGGGAALQTDAFIGSVRHEGSPADWTTTFGLISASFFSNYLILDNSTFGTLDSNLLFY